MKKIILCSALDKEIRPIIRYFRARPVLKYKARYLVYFHDDPHVQVYLIVTGMGPKNTFHNLEYFIKQLELDKNSLWIMTGYAGGVAPNLKTGEFILPTLVKDKGEAFPVPVNNHFKVKEKSTLFSAKKIVGHEEKKSLREQDPLVEAVDLEAAAFCRVMHQNHIRDFFIYKVITDDLNFVLPDFRLIRDSIGKVMLPLLLSNWGQIKNTLQIHYNMARASWKIKHFFKRFYEGQSH